MFFWRNREAGGGGGGELYKQGREGCTGGGGGRFYRRGREGVRVTLLGGRSSFQAGQEGW